MMSPHTFRCSLGSAVLGLVLGSHALLAKDVEAQSLYQQGIKAQRGDGRPVDLDAGRTLLEQAAAAGSTEAMDRLGDMSRDGDGGAIKDYAKAVEWYNKEIETSKAKGARPGAGAWGLISLRCPRVSRVVTCWNPFSNRRRWSANNS